MNTWLNISHQKADFSLETFEPTPSLTLKIDSDQGTIEILMTPEQLKDLRRTIEWTEAELNEMANQ